MKLFKKIGAGLLLSLGFFCLMITVSSLVDKKTTTQEQNDSLDSAIGGLVLGVPMIATGGWIVRGLQKQYQKDISDRLQSAFYRLVQQENGHISVLSFAISTQITPAEAKQYLDNKARELNATFETNDSGGVSYYFNI